MPAVDVSKKQRCLHATASHLFDRLYSVVRHLTSFPAFNVNVTDDDGETLRHFVVFRCHIDVVRRLMSFPKVNLNATSNDGDNPLHFAAMRDHIVVVRHLASLFAVDMNVMNNVWLHYATLCLLSRLHGRCSSPNVIASGRRERREHH